MNKDRIIAAVDVDSTEKAIALVEKLIGRVGAFKVGLELVNAAGLGVIDCLLDAGAGRVFYDCKFHDIPNTVAGASKAACGMGVWMFNVHCSGGSAMMRAAREAADKTEGHCPLVIGVTVLTSISQEALREELGVSRELKDHVVKLAELAKEAGLDGVVASPHEIEAIRSACGPDFIIVTPGVRPAGADVNDQKRVMSPAEAVTRGADYLVIGRPITRAEDPTKAADEIAQSIG